jgi:ribosomal protein S18 acetylase RimI-like enzyme
LKIFEDIISEINFVEKIEDIIYIKVDNVIYGIQDISDKYKSAIEEAKILTKEEKLKEFRKIIPSYEAFKNLIKEKNGLIKIEGMFHVILLDITKPIIECYYLERIVVDPKYENAGIGSTIYSYIERIVKEYGYKCILVAAIGTWQIINFYKRQGFSPTEELDAKYIVPLLEQLNDKNLAITDDKGKRYIMPMVKNLNLKFGGKYDK